jgi:hypothetical protein
MSQMVRHAWQNVPMLPVLIQNGDAERPARGPKSKTSTPDYL